MAVRSSFFNSVNGDRRYKSNHFAEYFASFIANGIFPNPSNTLQVYEKTNMTVTVKPGKGWINGYFAINEYDYDLTLDNADGILNRIDRIVLRLDFNARAINLAVKKGAFASAPVAPILQRDADAHELALADIYVTKGTTFIRQSNIADQRLDKALCGVVHGTVSQVDTTTIFNQYSAWFAETTGKTESEISQWQLTVKAEFDEWFVSIQNILDGDVAANLAARITTLEQQLATHQADLAHVHWIGTAVGTNTLTATYEPITTLKNGLGVAFLNTTSSTLATTLNINGLGAIPILKANGNPVTNLKANGIYTIRYANGNFILQGEGGEYGTATASDVLAGKTIGTENGIIEGIATVASLGGKRWASGDAVSVYRDGYPTIDVKNLGFTPTLLYAQKKTEPENYSIVLAIKDSSSGFFGFNSFVVYKIPNGYYDALKPFYWVGLIPTTKFLTDGFSLATNNSNANEYKNPHTYRWLAIE